MRLIGRILEERYEVLVELGRGGMGTVYKGLDKELNRSVAIKVMSPNVLTSKEAKKRFSREMKAYARLSHHNIVQVYSFGTLETSQPYIILEFVNGDTLGEFIFDQGAVRIPWVKSILRQMASALAYIHRCGLVHRDLKPENIMVVSEGAEPPGRVVIMDFGLVRTMDGTALTKTGTILGTPLYMPPEQAQGKQMNAQADIYQLGLIGYEMLTGKRAINGESIDEVMVQILSFQCPLLKKSLPLISPKWQDFIEKCVASNLNDRFASADEVLTQLEELPPDGKKSGPKEKEPEVLTVQPETLVTEPEAEQKSKGPLIALLLLLLAVPLCLWLGGKKDGPAQFWTRVIPDEVVKPIIGKEHVAYHFLSHNGNPDKIKGYSLPGPNEDENLRLNEFKFPESPKARWLGNKYTYFSRVDDQVHSRFYKVDSFSTNNQAARCYIILQDEKEGQLEVRPKWLSIPLHQSEVELSFILRNAKASTSPLEIVAGPRKGKVKNIEIKECTWFGNEAKVSLALNEKTLPGAYVFCAQHGAVKVYTLAYLCHQLTWPKTAAIKPSPTQATLTFFSQASSRIYRWKVKREEKVIREAQFTHDGGPAKVTIRGLEPEETYVVVLTDGSTSWQETFSTLPVLLHRPVFSCAHKGNLFLDYKSNLDEGLRVSQKAAEKGRLNWQLSHNDKLIASANIAETNGHLPIPIIKGDKPGKDRHPKFGEFIYFTDSFVFADGFGLVCCKPVRVNGIGGKVDSLSLQWVYRPPNLALKTGQSRSMGGLVKIGKNKLLYTYLDAEQKAYVGTLHVKQRALRWRKNGGPAKFGFLPPWVEDGSSSWHKAINKLEWRVPCTGLTDFQTEENGLLRDGLVFWQTTKNGNSYFGIACYEFKKRRLLWHKTFSANEIYQMSYSPKRTSPYERALKWKNESSLRYLDSPVSLGNMVYSLARTGRASVGYERCCVFLQCPMAREKPKAAKLLERFPTMSLEQALTVDKTRNSVWFVGRDHLYRWEKSGLGGSCEALHFSTDFPIGYNSSGVFLHQDELLFVRWHHGPESATLLPFQRDVVLPRPYIYSLAQIAPNKVKVTVYGPQLFVNQSSFPGRCPRPTQYGKYLALNGRHNLAVVNLDNFKLGTMTPDERKIRAQGVDSFGLLTTSLEDNSLFTIPLEFLAQQNRIALHPVMTKVLQSNILSFRSDK